MATLTGTLFLTRAVVTEMTRDNPNKTKVNVVAGTSGGVGGGGGRVDSTVLDGDFRSYGNGATRLILGSGSTITQTLALRALTPSQVLQIEGLTGKTICFRDTYGRRIIGAYLSTQETDIPLSGKPETNTLLTDVGLVIQTVTYSEQV